MSPLEFDHSCNGPGRRLRSIHCLSGETVDMEIYKGWCNPEFGCPCSLLDAADVSSFYLQQNGISREIVPSEELASSAQVRVPATIRSRCREGSTTLHWPRDMNIGSEPPRGIVVLLERAYERLRP